jgi:hypothetical protein
LVSRVGQELKTKTLDRPLSALTWTVFDSALYVLDLDPDPESAIQWWQGVEHRILAERDHEWLEKILDPLLGSDGSAAARDPKSRRSSLPESRLRPLLLASQASVYLHLAKPAAFASIWREVEEKAAQVGVANVADALAIRALAGLLACQRMSVTSAPEYVARIHTFWRCVAGFRKNPKTFLKYFRAPLEMLAGLIAAAETLLENAEEKRPFGGPFDSDTWYHGASKHYESWRMAPLAHEIPNWRLAISDELDQACQISYRGFRVSKGLRYASDLAGLAHAVLATMPVRERKRGNGLFAFACLLAARGAAREGKWRIVWQAFKRALAAVNESERGVWADWVPPVELAARAGLEVVRAALPRYTTLTRCTA